MQMLQQIAICEEELQEALEERLPKNSLASLTRELVREYPRESFKHGFMHLMIEYQKAYDSDDIDKCMDLTMKFESYLAKYGFQGYEFFSSMCKSK